jgi:hypothetical protein
MATQRDNFTSDPTLGKKKKKKKVPLYNTVVVTAAYTDIS